MSLGEPFSALSTFIPEQRRFYTTHLHVAQSLAGGGQQGSRPDSAPSRELVRSHTIGCTMVASS